MTGSELEHDLKAHIVTCEAVRRLTLWSMVALATINAIVIVFVTAQTFTIKGRQDGVLRWIDNAEETRVSDYQRTADRITALVAANVQREVTFGDRFKSIELGVAELRQQVFALHDKPTIGRIYRKGVGDGNTQEQNAGTKRIEDE